VKPVLLCGAGLWLLAGPTTGLADAGPHGPPAVMAAPATYPDIEFRIRDTRDDGYISAQVAKAKLDKVYDLRVQEAQWRAKQDGVLKRKQIKELTAAYALVEAGVCDADEEPVNNKCK
jgi:hypothetical protein